MDANSWIRICYLAGAVLFLEFALSPKAHSQTLEEYHGQRYILRTVAIPESGFTSENLRLLSQRILQEGSDDLLLRVRIVTDPSAVDWRNPVPAKDAAVGASNAMAEKIQTGPDFKLAEIVAMQKDAVIRVRYSRVRMEETTLGGRNPLIVNLGSNLDATVEWIEHWLPGDRFVAVPQGLLHNVSVFATVPKAIDERTAERLYVALKARIPHLLFILHVAPLAWFPLESEFPIVSPFKRLSRTPSPAEYEQLRRVTCVMEPRTGVQCTTMPSQ